MRVRQHGSGRCAIGIVIFLNLHLFKKRERRNGNSHNSNTAGSGIAYGCDSSSNGVEMAEVLSSAAMQYLKTPTELMSPSLPLLPPL